MPQIQVLDSETINRIAAGEVVERPASVIKELVENAMDAGAGAITVEIKDGGISFMRITDNGCGIEKNQVRNAFMRHATSKIKSAEDLSHIASLGFRGEALSSICAVSQVELITKTEDSLTGVHLMMEGEKELVFEEIGAPKGTTFLIRNLFFNTPARKKFLKSPSSECGAITDLMEHLALSRPDIAMKFVVGNQTKFYTSGNGDIREVIYRLYGKDFINNLIEFHTYRDGMEIKGYLGNPSLVRSNRNFEVFFLNGRYIKSTLLAKALEEGYRQYLMQHKFPLCFLDFCLEDLSKVDVNVHPSKMEVRFQEEMQVFSFISEAVRSKLMHKEMIPAVSFHGEMHTAQKDMGREAALQEEVKIPEPLKEIPKAVTVPEPFEFKRKEELEVKEEFTLTKEKEVIQEFDQMNLFQEKILSTEKRKQFRLIGQVFDTYWMVECEGKLLIIDQHAAHEKVKYEKFMEHYRTKNILSQNLMPSIVVSLSGSEEKTYLEYADIFAQLGFEIDNFGGREYTIRAVPMDLYGCNEKELFLQVLDELAELGGKGEIRVICDKIASMSCKAAVKGNNMLHTQEAQKLIDELLQLENPYNCPHGRPTIISVSKYEMEKKFKR